MVPLDEATLVHYPANPRKFEFDKDVSLIFPSR